MTLNFMFVCNPKKLQVWWSKLSTYSCFHLENFDDANVGLNQLYDLGHVASNIITILFKVVKIQK